MKNITAKDVIAMLGLVPHPEEGGWFLETHRSSELFDQNALPGWYAGPRCLSTAIYYLLTPETYSHMHRLKTDEIFHFYAGHPCEMVQLHPDGTGETVVFGNVLSLGQKPQVRVPRNSWQGMRLMPGGAFALMGCTVAPGFEFADYAHGDRSALVAEYPDFTDNIIRLTSEK